MLSTAGTTNYCYAADGTKLAVRDAGGNGFAYLGSLILSPSSTEFQFSDGVIHKTTSGYEVNYFLRDHLGSVRTVVNAAGEVVQQSDYYPFGSKQENATYVNNSNRFLYNSKELQTTGNLGFLDYGARMYDAKLGRWFVQDNLAEKYPMFSSYLYCAANPIRYIDLDGNDWYQSTDKDGKPTGQYRYAEGSGNIKGYTNIGETYSAQNEDGSYYNYYQNIRFSGSESFDAKDYILSNNALLGSLLGKNSPLSRNNQSRLMASSIYNLQKEFLKTSAEIGASSLEMTGGIISGAGYVVSLTGVGAPVGLGMVELGGGLAGLGGMAGALINYHDDPAKSIVQIALSGFNFGLSRAITGSTLSTINKLSANLIFDIKFNFMNYVVNNKKGDVKDDNR